MSENGKKYRLTDETTLAPNGNTLYRIEAIRDFVDIEKHDLGRICRKRIESFA